MFAVVHDEQQLPVAQMGPEQFPRGGGLIPEVERGEHDVADQRPPDLGGGLIVYKWPLLFRHEHPWPPMTSVVSCMLVAVSVLALAGLFYPLKMLPIMLFEVMWKLLWLGAVALPEWLHHTMDPATRALTTEVFSVVIILATIPGRLVLTGCFQRVGVTGGAGVRRPVRPGGPGSG